MQLSHIGLVSIETIEGFKATAYKDSGGVWTIGFGTVRHDGIPVAQGDTCTQGQAELWLQADLAWAQTAVNQLVRTILSQNQFDALVSFVYNEGEPQFAKSTLLAKLNTQDFIGAAKQFDSWVYVGKQVIPGLVTRRRIERDMFEGHSNSS